MATANDRPGFVMRESSADSRSFLPYQTTSDYDRVPTEEKANSPQSKYSDEHTVTPTPALRPEGRHGLFSMQGLIVRCLVTPIMGFAFIALGVYTIYGPHKIVISHSTVNQVFISQAFTALLCIWHFVALIPALAAVLDVKSEEWWRRLSTSSPFSHVNSVSSNINGVLAHTFEVVSARSSLVYRTAWVAAIVAVVLGDIGPGAMQVEIGLRAVPASLEVPGLLPNSIWSNYAAPFRATGDTRYSSMDLAPIYLTASFDSVVVKAAPIPQTIIPRPNLVLGRGLQYATDVAFLNYTCDWHAPVLAEPDTVAAPAAQMASYIALNITAGGIRGTGYPPIYGNNIFSLQNLTDPTTGAPSFEGYLTFAVYSSSQDPNFFNLSSVPSSSPSSSWQAFASAYTANMTAGSFVPVGSMSVVVCSPNIVIQSWNVQLVNGTMNLLHRASQPVGNLDRTQLGIAIQDSYNEVAISPPTESYSGYSTTQLLLVFTSLVYPLTPRSSMAITDLMNYVGVAAPIQAYLDGGPFGNVTPTGSNLLIPALVLVSQPGLLWATAALYTILSIALVHMYRRSSARPLTMRNILDTTHTSPISESPETITGPNVVHEFNRLATSFDDANGAVKEKRVLRTVADRRSRIVTDPSRRHIIQVDSYGHASHADHIVERYAGARLQYARFGWLFTPVTGGLLFGFGIACWIHPRVVSYSSHGRRAILLSALFTWAMGIWRSVSLISLSALVRQATSDEWSRLITRKNGPVLSSKLRAKMNDISTNAMSFKDSFVATWTIRTTVIFKLCYIAALLTSLCGFVAQGSVTLISAWALTPANLPTLSLIRNATIDTPWSANTALAPYNAGPIAAGASGTNYVYLEQIMGVQVGDVTPAGYIVPTRGATNNTYGSHYPTDVARIQCECSWVIPTLDQPPPGANASLGYFHVALPSMNMTGIQAVTHSIPTYTPVSNMTYTNGTAVTSGLFAWTLWGGGAGDVINLDSVPHAELSTDWINFMANELVPGYAIDNPINAQYISNLTQVTTLVCDPNIEIFPMTARAFGGAIDLTAPPKDAGASIGTLEPEFVRFLLYTYAVQQAMDERGIFRDYLFIAEAAAHATLYSDPANPEGGVVPRAASDISLTMNGYLQSASKAWTVYSVDDVNATMVQGQIVQQALIVAAGLPQVVVTGSLYLLLGIAAWLISRRKAGAPFTLAGILMMQPTLSTMQIPAIDGILNGEEYN